MGRSKLILIDGNSLAHRAFWALPDLKTMEGIPTSAIYGFLSMLFRLLEEERPTHLAVAFDRAEPTFRHAEFSGYKSQRGGSPEEFRMQIPLLKEILKGLGVAIFEKEGYEADDILGCLAREGSRAGAGVLVVTGDKDALQLIDENVRVLLTRRGITEIAPYDRETVRLELGISPEQVPDVKGLMGDPSDNIPGVPGVGEKIAFRLIQRWGSLENVLDHWEELDENRRVKEALKTYREQALLSKRLATIDPEVPLEADLESCRWHLPDPSRVEGLFRQLELRTLWGRLQQLFAAGEKGPPSRTLVAAAPEVRAVEDGERLEVVWTELRERLSARPGSPLALVPYLEGARPLQARLAGLALAAPGYALYLSPAVSWEEARPRLQFLCEQEDIPKCGHDLKPFLVWLRQQGVQVRGLSFDSLLAAYLLDPTRSAYPLSQLAREFLGREVAAREDMLGKGKSALPFSALPLEVAASWLGSQALACQELVGRMRVELQALSLDRLMEGVEIPLLPVLAEMEWIGVRVDLRRVAELAREFGERIAAVAQEVYRLAGCAFNINSTHQLQEVLFEKLGLPAKHRTKTGYSTSAEALEELRTVHPVVEKILEHRTLVKLKGTYLDGMPDLVDPRTGRVHTTFNQAVTATGRLSSNDPNLQNIPVRDELGRRIRQVFIPAEGCVFLSGDYSQIELRLLAHVSQDPSLVEAFRQGEDIHCRTAAEVFGVPMEQVTEEMRSRAKAVNFGIVYGISDYGLSQQLGISRGEAREYITSYFLRYAGVRRWVDEILARARAEGSVTTLLGRRRQLPGILSRNPQERGFAERTAINTPLQGSAADIIKLAMVKLRRELERREMASKIILQVHDELILEVPREELPATVDLVRSAMQDVIELSVPLRVDLKVGPSWYDLAPLLR